jgi:hypothetical protein
MASATNIVHKQFANPRNIDIDVGASVDEHATALSAYFDISDVHATFGHNVRPRHCSMMYSEPL